MQALTNLTSDYHAKDDMVEYYLSGVSILVVSVVGVSGNIVSGHVLRTRQRDTHQTLRDLLMFLAGVNSVFLVLVVMVFSLPQFSSSYRNYVLPYIVPTALPCASVAMTGSIYLVIALSVERVLTMPGVAMGNKGAILGYILPTTFFSIVYTLPKYFEFSTQLIEDENGFIPHIHPTHFQQSYSFYVSGADLFFLGMTESSGSQRYSVTTCNTAARRGVSRKLKVILKNFVG